MPGFIIGAKAGSSQTFDDAGRRIPTTIINTQPCYVVDIMTPSKNNYLAVKLGFGVTKSQNKPQTKEIEKAGVKTPLRFLREINLKRLKTGVELIEENGKKGVAMGEIKLFVGDIINPTVFFKKGDLVSVSGTSKGKGFQGVVRRHGFAGGPKTHGQSDRLRAPGSIGQTTTPGRVYKGKRMAGHMGEDRVTVQNLIVVDVTESRLLVKGMVPGHRNGLLEVRTNEL